MSEIVYGRGGYRPLHPSQGKIEEHDDGTEQVTRWDDAGTQVERRAYTAAEKADKATRAATAAREGNTRTIEDRARAALTANATYLALASPTNAQNLAQIRLLTRECSALIRLALDDLDTIDGT